MKTASIRDLRYDFSRLEAWLRNGDEIQITRRGQPLGRLVPIAKAARARLVKPDFAERLRKIWGDRVFTADEVRTMRDLESGDRS